RLVLGEKGKKPFLQGWGVVENPTDEDWSSVGMTLVSGRPISFKMDLYQPIYVPRPMVQQELFASLQPQVYGGGMGSSAPIAPPLRGAGMRARGETKMAEFAPAQTG